MNQFICSKVLAELYNILCEDRSSLPTRHSMPHFERNLIARRVATFLEIGDYLILTERRHYNSIERLFEALIDPLSVPRQTLYYKPECPEDEVSGFEGLTAIDTVGLLIDMEHLGLQVDPSRLVTAMTPEIVERSLMTSSELSVLMYQHDREKKCYVLKAAPNTGDGKISEIRHKDASGYQFTMTWRGGAAVRLEIRGPRYTEPKPQEFVVCDYCKHRYLTNSSAEERIHAKEHEWTRQLYEPSPNENFARQVSATPTGEFVGKSSPLWMHEEVLQRARAFRREFGYDIVQWDGSANSPASEGWHGYLFAGDDVGTIAGACGFLPESSGAYEGQWALHWIWFAPKYRRKGLLHARWAEFLQRYGSFHIERPVSEAMQSFVRKHGTEEQKAWLPPQKIETPGPIIPQTSDNGKSP